VRRIVIGFFAVVFSSLSAFAQVSTQQPSQGTATQTATKDSQAVSVLNQALSAAGGAAAIKAVADYTAVGNITYHLHNGHDVQGMVQVLGGSMGQVRVDSTLPSGTRSWAIDQGRATKKAEDGTVSKPPTGPIPSSDVLPYRAPRFPNSIAFPYKQLLTVLNSSAFDLSYKGLVQLDGHSVHDIEAEPVPRSPASSPYPTANPNALDFFIDMSTLQLVMVQDIATKGTVHQVRYSNYTATNGVLVPFSIEDQLGTQSTWTIQLAQITYNSGLQDSAFVIQ
jgi:hypothetical protein